MEKDIGKINKNDQSDIIIRIDDFGGKRGLTIREFVTSERYTGFTKAGVRIPADDFQKFKEMINSVSEEEMKEAEVSGEPQESQSDASEQESSESGKANNSEELPDY